MPSDFSFTLDFVPTPGSPFSFPIQAGQTENILFNPGDVVQLTEQPAAGWEFAGADCINISGMTITEIDGGIEVFCPQAGGGTGEFIFLNLLVTSVPTLSEWGMMAAAAGLLLVGVFFAVRQRLRASKQSDARG